MISPLGRGHRGGTLSISGGSALDSNWAREAAVEAKGRATGALGSAATAAEGRTAGALGPTATAALGVEVPTGRVELRRTLMSLKVIHFKSIF